MNSALITITTTANAAAIEAIVLMSPDAILLSEDDEGNGEIASGSPP